MATGHGLLQGHSPMHFLNTGVNAGRLSGEAENGSRALCLRSPHGVGAVASGRAVVSLGKKRILLLS